MPASIIIPFNQNPIETSVKTTNYTIPAGKYAKVTPFFNSVPDTTYSGSATGTTTVTIWNCQLDGVVVLQSDACLTFDVGGTATRTFSAPTQHKAILTMSSGTTTVSYNSRVLFDGAIATATTQQVYYISAGANLAVQNTSGQSRGAVQYEFSGNKGISFWVEDGVVLGGSGTFRWLVEEFNVIS